MLSYKKSLSKKSLIGLVLYCSFIFSFFGNTVYAKKFKFPEFVENQSSLTGMRVTVSSPVGFIKSAAHTIFLVKFDEQGELDFDEIYQSTISKSGNIYLFDFEPNKYAIISAVASGGNGGSYSYILKEESAKKTAFAINSGKFEYLGNLRIKTTGGAFKKDEYQKSVITAIKESKLKVEKRSSAVSLFQGGGVSIGLSNVRYSAYLKETRETSEKFFKKAKRFFKKQPDWKKFVFDHQVEKKPDNVE